MGWTPTYHVRNLKTIDELAPNTKLAAKKWYQYCLDNKVDILIYEGMRTLAEQKENVRRGVSKTLKSYHLVGQAIDFVPISKGKANWGGYSSPVIKKAVAYAKNIGFEWGGDWTSFRDCPHLQFNYKGYGTDLRVDTSSTVKTGKRYRIQTGTWGKTQAGVEAVSKAEQVFRGHGFVVYREDEGGSLRLKTGTFENYEHAAKWAKEIQQKYGWLCYPIEA